MVKRATADSNKKEKKKDSLPSVRCKGCVISFVPRDHRQHYHSDTCRENYYQQKYFGKVSTHKICPNCGIEFSTNKPMRQSYCTPDCREDARKKRQDGIAATLTTEKVTFLRNRFSALEKDGFKCIYCGKSVHDGIKLDVQDNGKGELHSICNICAEGQRLNISSK